MENAIFRSSVSAICMNYLSAVRGPEVLEVCEPPGRCPRNGKGAVNAKVSL
jgi:hypothetical protein